MKQIIKNSLPEDVYTGLVKLIKTEMSVDLQWLSRITATPETILEMLLELTRYERSPQLRDRYRAARVEERIIGFLQSLRFMGEKEREKLTSTIMNNKLFLVP